MKRTTDKQSEADLPLDNGISYAGFLQITNAILRPEIFFDWTGNEFKLLYYLTFLLYRFPQKKGRHQVTYSYLSNGTGLSEPTVKRCLKSLAKKMCISVQECPRKEGKTIVIFALLLWENPKKLSDQNDRTQFFSSDQNDRAIRSKRSDSGRELGTLTDQIDHQSNINTSFISAAVCHGFTKQSQGGEIDLGQRSPTGQDQNEGRSEARGKGILSDSIRGEIALIQATGFPAPR